VQRSYDTLARRFKTKCVSWGGQSGGHGLQQSAALVTAELTGLLLESPTTIAAVSSTYAMITMRAIFILKLHDD
jgi:hypothetical protein